MSEEFKYYNDYIRMTKFYLRHLNKLRVTLDNLNLEADKLQKELSGYDDIPSPVAAYQEKMPKSTTELSNVEAIVEKRRVKNEQIMRIRRKIIRLNTLIQKIDNSVNALSDEDKRLLQDYLIDGRDAEGVGWTHHCSERTVRYNAARIVRILTGMLFGPESVAPEQDFVFAE